MTTSNTITKTDLENILNEVLPVDHSFNYIDVTISSAQNFSSQNTYEKVNIDTIRNSRGGFFTLDPTNHEIIIGDGVSFVEVSAQVYLTTISNHNVKFLSIFLNDSSYKYAIAQPESYNAFSASGIIPVKSGDRISLRYQSQSGTTEIYNSNATFLSVKAVGIDSCELAPQADYIVEQGKSGIWTYRKWNSGIAECWGITSYASATFSAAGNSFMRGFADIMLPTNLFNIAPIVFVNPVFGNVGSARTGSISASKFNVAVLSTISNASEVELQLFAKGTWK